MPFTFAVPRKNTETLLEGIKLVFEFFGGVPKSVTFTMTSFQFKIPWKDDCEKCYLNVMMAYYVFYMDFCNRVSDNEKGLVEGLVDRLV